MQEHMQWLKGEGKELGIWCGKRQEANEDILKNEGGNLT